MNLGAFWSDIGLLVLRLGAGGLMLTHGFQKLSNFGALSEKFADPFGLGMTASLALAVFAEFFCSLGLIVGLATRLATIPLLVTMLTAFFVIHADDPMQKKELALLYVFPYAALLFTGPGRLSLDHLFGTLWSRRKASRAPTGRVSYRP